MSLVKNKLTGNWEADFRSNAVGRLHLSLRTKRKSDAMDRHAALAALVREHPAALIEDLRAGRITVEAVASAYSENKPFATLSASTQWPTLGEARELLADYMNGRDDLAQGTRDERDRILSHASEWFGAAKRVDAITPDDVTTWKAHLAANGASGRKIKGWSVAQYLIHFGALYTWLIRREQRAALREQRPPRLLHNPVESEIIPERPETTARALSKEEAQRLIESTPDRYRYFVGLGLFAGLRLGETRMLRPAPHDIDLENGIIMVQPREGWRPKSRKRRDVPIGPELLAIVKHHAERYASERWMMPALDDRRTTRHARAAGGPVARDTLGMNFEIIVRRAGLPYGKSEEMGVTYHTLRHTFASWLVMDGVDLFTVAKLLGHADTKLVESTYGHLSPDHKRIAVGRLGKGLNITLPDESPEGTE